MKCPYCSEEINSLRKASSVDVGLGLGIVFHDACLAEIEKRAKQAAAPVAKKAMVLDSIPNLQTGDAIVVNHVDGTQEMYQTTWQGDVGSWHRVALPVKGAR